MADLVTDSRTAASADGEIERLQRIGDAWSAYNGTNPLPVKLAADGTDDNVRINLARAIVDKSVSWLFGADRSLAFAIDAGTDEASLKAQNTLGELWPEAARASCLHQCGVNGAVTGHVFLRLIAEPEVRVIVLDPSNMTVFWDQEDISRVLEYRYEWTAFDTKDATNYVRRQSIVRDETAGTWTITDSESRGNGDVWKTIGEETWPHDWAPIFDCQNLPAPNEYYGAADLEREVLDLLNSMQFVVGYARKLIRHKGHPLPYVIGESAERIAELDVALGRMLAIPNANATIGQLQAGDLGATLDLYALLREALHETTRTPAIAFGTSMANVAEETVELAFAPAVEKTWDKRITYGPMLTDLAGRILELGGIPDLKPSPQWSQVVPRSAKSEAEALERDLRMGIVSKETASRRRGYEWEIEKSRMADEGEASAESLARAFNAGM